MSTGLPIPVVVQRYGVMWKQLFDDEGFAAKWGLRAAEKRSKCYNYSWEHGDTWNQAITNMP